MKSEPGFRKQLKIGLKNILTELKILCSVDRTLNPDKMIIVYILFNIFYNE